EIAAMLFGMKNVIMKYGSLYACFKTGFINNGESVLPAITEFVEELISGFNCRSNSLLPLPAKGSACKRLNLFLRWMVRRDDVDPGGWDDISPSKLVIPLDTHMHKICLALGITKRKQANMKTALEITRSFQVMAPHDPVRYDFSLTRLGIRKDTDIMSFLDELGRNTGE
ncbi:MAG: TIGR02757 family protein, partial [Syntrophobacterales bacterium]|nr:TIGR02757 family protein [Syntrophobacterales bacterium]